jgi:hypothetical protein
MLASIELYTVGFELEELFPKRQMTRMRYL